MVFVIANFVTFLVGQSTERAKLNIIVGKKCKRWL